MAGWQCCRKCNGKCQQLLARHRVVEIQIRTIGENVVHRVRAQIVAQIHLNTIEKRTRVSPFVIWHAITHLPYVSIAGLRSLLRQADVFIVVALIRVGNGWRRMQNDIFIEHN